MYCSVFPIIFSVYFMFVNVSLALHPLIELKPTVTGTVFSKNGEPVIGALVHVEGTMIHTTTDLDGKFQLSDIPKGSYVLKISSLGYKTTTKPFEIVDDTAIHIQISFEDDALLMPEVLIMGKTDRLFSRIPGSASYIGTAEIKQINPISGNEVFRRSPGLHVVDEEGAGLRINIGIRGLDPDRSRSLLVLEDGIPVALAPYGEPEMYYTPAIDRMAGIEILKGSGQILYGPQTIGGVVNYLTHQPPAEATGKLKIHTGQGNLWNGLLNYGNTHGKIGYNITMLKKRADKLGLTQFDITDLNTKLVINFNEKSMILIKAGLYKERSNATYIGLTQTMYNAGNQDFVHMAPNDLLKIDRYSFSLQHSYKWNSKTQLKSSVYAYTTSRNWRRQDFISNTVGNVKPSNWIGVTWGDEAIVGGAIYMRSSTGNRNRQFEVAGMETGLIHEYGSLGLTHKLKAGVRYLYEKANEQRVNGSQPNVSSGALVEDETRPGNALSMYVHQLTKIRTDLEFHYGVRLEHFRYGRDINRRSFLINNQSQIRDTILNKSNALTQLIPGAGFTWTAITGLNFFGGIHAGFAPPRTKDAISNAGDVYDLSAEKV
ncbi:MAG: carboxypeptidase-like regulatory domain-containing protein [Saprospiraceae bacterium]|nr:carboxypeptidase-like regulatory domain-containing protein [Saprospiraceae bacterium]